MKSELMLWAAIAISPIAWFLNLEANFALAPLACPTMAKSFLYIVSGVTLVLSILAGAISVRYWQVPERNAAGEVLPLRNSIRAMALAGIALSALSSLTIVAQAIPTFLLAGCE